MKLCFVGTSFAPAHLKAAAVKRGFDLVDDPAQAEIVFVSEDTPTDAEGKRDLQTIEIMVRETFARTTAPVVLTSQVPPGFCRSLNLPIYHLCETLRVTQDAEERALNPEQMIIGWSLENDLPPELAWYLFTFEAQAYHKCTWETAEFCKIAINMTLASQVENTNRLSAAATKCGADWNQVKEALKYDKRIGHYSYLEPGNWKDSPHLLRDCVTLKEIEGG